jgi:hypothetical protein
VNALYTEAKELVEQAKSDERELEELREMRSDVERKEKQQAAIIEHQVGFGGTTGLRHGCLISSVIDRQSSSERKAWV